MANCNLDGLSPLMQHHHNRYSSVHNAMRCIHPHRAIWRMSPERLEGRRRHSRVSEVCLIELDRRRDLVQPDIPCHHARHASWQSEDTQLSVSRIVLYVPSGVIVTSTYRPLLRLPSAGTRSASSSMTCSIPAKSPSTIVRPVSHVALRKEARTPCSMSGWPCGSGLTSLPDGAADTTFSRRSSPERQSHYECEAAHARSQEDICIWGADWRLLTVMSSRMMLST